MREGDVALANQWEIILSIGKCNFNHLQWYIFWLVEYFIKWFSKALGNCVNQTFIPDNLAYIIGQHSIWTNERNIFLCINPKNWAGSVVMTLLWLDCVSSLHVSCCSLLKCSRAHISHLQLSNPAEGQWRHPHRPVSFIASKASTAGYISQCATFLDTFLQLCSLALPIWADVKRSRWTNTSVRSESHSAVNNDITRRAEHHRAGSVAAVSRHKPSEMARLCKNETRADQTRPQGGKVKERQEWEHVREDGERRGVKWQL